MQWSRLVNAHRPAHQHSANQMPFHRCSETSELERAEYIARHGSTDTPFTHAFWTGHPDALDPCLQAQILCEAHWTQNPATYDNDILNAELPFSSFNDDPVLDALEDDANLTFRFNEAEVTISLAPLSTDDLLLPAELLKTKLPWFKSVLDDKWKLPDSKTADEHYPAKVRFELLYDNNGDAYLDRVLTPMPWLERLTVDNEALNETNAPTSAQLFDSDSLDTFVRDTHDCQHGRYYNPTPDGYRRTVIDSYKLFFAIKLGIHIDIRKMPVMINTNRNWTLLLLKIIDHADYYSTIEDSRAEIEEFILNNPGPYSIHTMDGYSGTYLRIACILRSERIFQHALTLAASQPSRVDLKSLAGDHKLEAMIFTAAHEIQQNLNTAVGFFTLAPNVCTPWRLADYFEPSVLPIWNAWLAAHHRRLNTVPQYFRPLMLRILDDEVDTRDIVRKFIDEHGWDEGVPEDLEQYFEYLVGQLDQHMREAKTCILKALDPSKPGFHRKHNGFNGLDFKAFRYPWLQDDEPIPPTKLTLLYERAIHPNRRIEDPNRALHHEYEKSQFIGALW